MEKILDMKFRSIICLLVVASISADVMAVQNQPLHLKTYKGQGVDQVDQNNGQQLWNSVVNKRSCTSCHGDDPIKIGRHIKTGKNYPANGFIGKWRALSGW